MTAGRAKFDWAWPRSLSLRSMRGRMALLLALAMVPAGGLAMQAGLSAVAVREASFDETLVSRALQAIDDERRVVGETRELLRVLASAPALRRIDRAVCSEWLANIAARHPYIAALSLTGEDDSVLCSAPPAPPRLPAAPSLVQQRARERDGFAIGFVAQEPLTQRPMLTALEPVRGDDGRRVAMVRASMDVEQLRGLLSRSALDGAHAAIVDHNGRIVVESELTPGEDYAALPALDRLGERFSTEPRLVPVRNGQAVVVPLHAPDLYVVLSWQSDRRSLPRWAGVAMSLGAPLIIWLLATFAGWHAIEAFVVRPLSSLEGAARSLARDENVADPPALRNAPDEIRSLRRTLAAMAKTLRGREQRLAEALREERALLREVHHRVKNNLQMVASLLNIQARAARDDSEARGLARAHDRVQLLALVHQRIYASGELRQLRVDELAAEISRNLLQSRGAQAREVNLQLLLGPARASVDRAVPLAFLIGEAVSAALDADADSGPVELRLMLEQDGESGEARFAIEPDLAPESANPLAQSSRLVDAFARQLGAGVGRDPERPYRLWVCVPGGDGGD